MLPYFSPYSRIELKRFLNFLIEKDAYLPFLEGLAKRKKNQGTNGVLNDIISFAFFWGEHPRFKYDSDYWCALHLLWLSFLRNKTYEKNR